jgi:formate-dependent nitrite reductase cytochrome c552 subunit
VDGLILAGDLIHRHTNDPAACANCHVVKDQYDGWLKSSHRAVAVCSDCHIEAAKAAGATDEDLAAARQAQPRGQFFVHFVESENSNGFHARQEATRILGDAIDLFRKPRCRCGR